MSRDLSESQILADYALQLTDRLIKTAVADLEDMTETGSGECSGLTNIWEEICVQLQCELSVMWDAYLETIRAEVDGLICELPSHEREALWLQTPEGGEWLCSDEDERAARPVDDSETATYLSEEHLFPAARKWTNENVEGYLRRSYERD